MDTTTSIAFSADKSSTLSRLSMAAQVSATSGRILADAIQDKNTARAARDQSKVAKAARETRLTAAATALKRAAAASQTADETVRRQTATQVALRAKLSYLKNKSIRVSNAYAAAEAARRAAEARARVAAARAAQSAAGPSTNPGTISAGGWTMPISIYTAYQGSGMRLHPVLKIWRMHAGADFSASCGTPIYAASAGTVTYAGAYGDYGNLITVRAANGTETNYAHMYSAGVGVRTGQTVQAGQPIAQVGNAGLSTGCHLHFEVRSGGVFTDPMTYLQSRGVSR